MPLLSLSKTVSTFRKVLLECSTQNIPPFHVRLIGPVYREGTCIWKVSAILDLLLMAQKYKIFAALQNIVHSIF